MTALGTNHVCDDLARDPRATYDLIICHGDRIVFHDYYQSPDMRLRMCVSLLTTSDILSSAIPISGEMEIAGLHQAHVHQWGTAPDSVINALAKLCRRWGVHIYVSTTTKTSAAPATLYSVVTEYDPGQSVAEHFTDRQTRKESLIERASQFFTPSRRIPESVLADEQRLVALLDTLLMPATISLTESVLDEFDGIYKPSDHPLAIR